MAGQKDTHFTNYFDPGTAQAWVGDAKGFLSQKLSDTDTGTVRTSPVLTSFGGDGVYLARRKDNGRWSNETFIVMETLDNGERVLVNGDEKSVAGILDTLLAVSRRTNFIAYAPDSLEIAEWRDSNREKGASARPDNLPPAYPDEERTVNHEGRVLLSFVVGENGRAEMGSVKVLYATSRAFLRSVIKGLQPMRFNAATVDGKPVRQRVTMPFEFSLMR
jgi:TonB family protein